MPHWHIITGEYPPQPGGVSGYTRLVADELAKAGDEVEVWAPTRPKSQDAEPGIQVHRLPGHFGPRALAIIDRAIAGASGERVLVQYVPHAFGLKAMNLPFSYWLYARRHVNITVMFHEVAFQRRMAQSLRHNLLGEVTSLMAALVARSARRIFVATQAWAPMLRRLVGNLNPIEWLPVPSNIPLVSDPHASEAIRGQYAAGGLLVGHFGTYGPKIRDYLEITLPQLLTADGVSVILLGRGSAPFRDTLVRQYPALARKLHATDGLPKEELSRHLSSCDLMIQPYPDGISARRTTAMAALAHGRAMVTTCGRLTEPLWIESGAVATLPADDAGALARSALALCDSPEERSRLGLAAATLYRERFDIRHTINALRTADADRDSKLVQP